MKISVALQFTGALLVLATEKESKDCTSVALVAIPSCAQPCYLENAPSIGCEGLDFACQCKQQSAMFAAIQGCVASKCPESLFEKVVDGSAEGESRIPLRSLIIASTTRNNILTDLSL